MNNQYYGNPYNNQNIHGTVAQDRGYIKKDSDGMKMK